MQRLTYFDKHGSFFAHKLLLYFSWAQAATTCIGKKMQDIFLAAASAFSWTMKNIVILIIRWKKAVSTKEKKNFYIDL